MPIQKYLWSIVLGCCLSGHCAAQLTTRIVKDSLFIPWEIIYGPDSKIWFNQKNGYICRMDPASGATDTLYHETATVIKGEGGMTGMALDPSFPATPYVYVAHNYTQGTAYKIRIMRYTYNGTDALTSPLVLLDGINGSTNHNGCRLAAVGDKLYITTGDAEDLSNPQLTTRLNGKVLRINLDGSVPGDNPFPGNPVWSWGHRNPQGLVAANGFLYSSEHGPNSDDEVNIIRKGRNYGWPTVKGFCDEPGELSFCNDSNVVTPLRAWTPTIAVAGIDYYAQAMFPAFQGALLMATLKDEHLYLLPLNSNKDSITSAVVVSGVSYGRLRDICISPAGRIYISTSNSNAAGTGPFIDKIVEVYDPSGVGIGGTNKLQARFYPNPVKETLTATFTENVTGHFTVLDLAGRAMLHGPVQGKQLQLTTGNFPEAVYYLRILTDDGQQIVQAFIKTH